MIPPHLMPHPLVGEVVLYETPPHPIMGKILGAVPAIVTDATDVEGDCTVHGPADPLAPPRNAARVSGALLEGGRSRSDRPS